MGRTEEIARHVAPELIDSLERLSPSELSSVVMHALRRIGRERDLPQVAEQFERTSYFAPSSVDPRDYLEIDRCAYAAASAFEAIELSPLVPLGASAVAGVDPNNVLTGVRQAEVASDPTMGQALECAKRRRRDRKTTVRLASSQRVVRLQPFDVPGYVPHFRLFTLVSAGRDTGDERFERAELLAHLTAWLDLLAALRNDDYAIGRVRVELSDTRVVRALVEAKGLDPNAIAAAVRGHKPGSGERLLEEAGVTLPRSIVDPATELANEPAAQPFLPRLEKTKREVFEQLAARHPGTECAFDLGRLQALAYYSGPTFKVVFGEGRWAVGDGGFTDWTQKILSDKKERMLASAIGTELIAKKFHPRVHRSSELRVDVLHSGIWKLSSVLISRKGSCWAIDPGYFPRELEAIRERSRAHGRVEAVAFTHGHWDHVIGWRTFPDAKVLGSNSLAEAVANQSERAKRDLDGAREFDGRWYVPRSSPLEWPRTIEPLAAGDRRDLAGTEIEVLELPGHSPDGIGLVIGGLLIAGDYLSPEEIPFVDDLTAYRATIAKLIERLASLDEVIPGHGPRLDRATALAIARADLEYLDRLAEAPDRERALSIPLPRAAQVPGMIDHHRENVAKAMD